MRLSVIIAILCLLIAATPVNAIDLTLRGEYDVELRSLDPEESLFPTRLQQQNLKLRLVGSESGKWSVEFRNVADSSGTPGGTLTFRKLQYKASFIMSPLTLDVWSGFDVGAGYVKSDPLKLVVMGSNGYEVWQMQNWASSPASDTVRVGTTLSVADTPVTIHYHQLKEDNAHRANLEAITEYGVTSDLRIGGLVRLGVTGDNPSSPSTHQAVGFVKTSVLGDLSLGASIGARFGEGISEDNLAYGVVGEKLLADGAAVVTASFTARQENFYEPNAIDSAYQSGANRFRNEASSATDGAGEGSILELIAAWKGEQNKDRDLRVILHPTSEAELAQLKEPAYMGIVRIMEDASPNRQTVVIGRAGAPLASNLFGVVEARYVSDEDGVTSVGGSTGATSRTQVRGVLRYNLDHLGWENWFLLGMLDTNSATGGSTDGSSTRWSAEVWYDAGKVRSVLGFTSETATNRDKPNNSIRLFFRLKF